MMTIVRELADSVNELEETTAETKRPTVLVTAARRKPALGITRALGRRGYEVITASYTSTAQSFFSKYATDTVVYEDPASDERTFVDDLLAAVARYDVDVLLPADHFTTISVSRFQDRFPSNVSVLAVEYETLRTVEDKERLLSIADDIGIPIPATYRPASLDELDDIAVTIEYPAVIKYNKGAGAAGVQYVDSPAELRSAYQASEEAMTHIDGDWPLVQEYIPGETHDVNALFVAGEPRAVFTARRTSTFPRSGGRAVITESTYETELIEYATRLLEHLDWHGIAEVEFKLDARTGQPTLMEVNPRIWGNIDLSIQAGVNFPALLCEFALTGDITSPESYAVGRKVIWLDEGFAGNLWGSPDRLDYVRYLISEYASGANTTVEIGDVAPHVVQWLKIGGIGARKALKGGLPGIASAVPWGRDSEPETD